VAICIYLFVAYKSSGYNNADEHYQIIEFARYKLGNAEPADLAWEYKEKIRAGIQPALCYALFKVTGMFGINDPYVLAFILRAFTGLVALVVISRFIISCRHLVLLENKIIFLLLSFFLWFLPYINVRFSSEAWSGIIFLASLSLVMDIEKYKKGSYYTILLGMGLGAAILFRYQTGVLAVGLLGWLLVIAKIGMKRLAVVCLSIVAVLGIGILIDKWLYGEYCLTIYNYFYVNIVKDVASQYGVSPWYEILFYLIKSPGAFGIFIFASYTIIIVVKPKHLLVWVTLPFLIIHAIIAHKELRFLYPIANLAPIVLVLGFQQMQKWSGLTRYRFWIWALGAVLTVSNIAGLMAIGLRGAGLTRISVTGYIRKNYVHDRVNIIHVGGCNPFDDGAFPKNTFYNSEGILLTQILTIWQADLSKQVKPGYTNLLIISNNEITGPRTTQLMKRMHLEKVFQSVPGFIQEINKLYDPEINNVSLMVYEFK